MDSYWSYGPNTLRRDTSSSRCFFPVFPIYKPTGPRSLHPPKSDCGQPDPSFCLSFLWTRTGFVLFLFLLAPNT
jgi:hypothetical protein